MPKKKLLKEQTLKQMAIAYKLACESDYCPDESELDEALDTLGSKFNPKDVEQALASFQGNRPDEIARMLVDEVLKSEG